jgi:hypothetical protein
MHKYINITKKYFKATFWLFLCVFFASSNTYAFMVSGGGNNLRIVQSNQAKSANFQVNAKLKPTASGNIVLASANSTSSTSSTTNTNATPTTTGGSDGSSPYTGTADWSKVGRSQRITEQRKLAKTKEEIQHASAPK